ncbi:MAG: Type 1 glutamine amidotransferase-like domain-containing protein [Rhizobacter sp.]|nr:Type 1 glutamine amidotransferase-like domain-containing protein [Ferruginibacter sp.]
MKLSKKLFLYSMNVTPQQCGRLTSLAGKQAADIKIAVIENATDPIPGDTSWQAGFREMLSKNGYQLEQIDLRQWMDNEKELEKKLACKDVIWLGGGNTYYLRWILRTSKADKMICKLVGEGKVYAGWSAGAVVAGPTTRFFNEMGDDPADAPEKIDEGLFLTDMVVVPHRDHPDFAAGAAKTNELLNKAGYSPVLMADNEALVIDGEHYTII